MAQDESTTPHAAGGSHSADSSVLDVSASEELSGHAYDLVDLSVRFCDVEWIKPVVTYDSLVEGNHPIDLRAVKDRLETYNSLVCDLWANVINKCKARSCVVAINKQ